MISALDCAYLADDVYNRANNNLAQERGWLRVDAQNWLHGFAAGIYERGGERVVAFRGTDTDDADDILSDARMVPVATVQQITRVVPTILHEYGVGDRTELVIGGTLLSEVLASYRARMATAVLANQAPPIQTHQAQSYLRQVSPQPVYLTGHSLGGALAKVISLNTGIPCIAFNSPYMGTLRGVVPMSSEGITSINARLDPLSLSTRAVGNLPHGRDIVVDTPACPRRPPMRPTVEQYDSGIQCAAPTGAWWTSQAGMNAYLSASFCELAREIAQPVGEVLSAPERYYRYITERRPDYVRELLAYLGEAAGYYHSMEALREAMMGMPRFRQPLRLR